MPKNISMKTYIWGDGDGPFEYDFIAVMANSIEEARVLAINLCKEDCENEVKRIETTKSVFMGKYIERDVKSEREKYEVKVSYINKKPTAILEPNTAKIIDHGNW